MSLKFLDSAKGLLPRKGTIFVVGGAKAFQKGLAGKVLPADLLASFAQALKSPGLGKVPQSLTALTGQAEPYRIVLSVLPDYVSKDNSPTRREWIYQQLDGIEVEEKSLVILLVDDKAHLGGMITAVTRRLRLVNFKKSAKPKTIEVLALDGKGQPIKIGAEYQHLADETAWACRMVDLPPNHLNPETYAKEIHAKFKGQKSLTITEITGKQLEAEGLNGIHSVGKAAMEAPRLVILDYKPRGASKTVALVGKGVCYDSGGLSLKVGGSMVGMKGDMGGSAAILGAFAWLLKNKFPQRVVAAVALVENAIGPQAFRNDDIIMMHSGKTVEVNNTDAEGRLLLADALSYCARKYKPDLMIDAATLTGAQLVATGLLHAAIISNDVDLEELASKLGRETGDLVHPLPFAPELFQNEFKSPVADMVNSVKNRANAQSSCAAQFIYAHIDDLDIPWLHIDLAGPASTPGGLGTGYGIQLIGRLAEKFL